MFNKQQLIQINNFLGVLKSEVLSFDKSLNWKTDSHKVQLYCSDGYSSTIVLIGTEAKIQSGEDTYIERDFADGLARLRFELIRHLNPIAF